MIQEGSKIVQYLIVYVGSLVHYAFQFATLEAIEIFINIVLGVFVAVYTFTQIVDWVQKQVKNHKARREAKRNQSDKD